MPKAGKEEIVLSVRDLTIEFDTANGPLLAVDHVSFEARANEVLAIVGESGSGKTLTVLSLMGLLPSGAHITDGEIVFGDEQLPNGIGPTSLARRGREVAMVFQDPMTALNPVQRIGRQIGEAIKVHNSSLSKSDIRARVIELLRLVEVPNPEDRVRVYPHQLSGGMRQRVMIAIAMANRPKLLIADEPTTALDVTIQAQVLDVLERARVESASSMILITHDLGLVAEVADRVIVLYGGRVMESADVETLFASPSHPYTQGLLDSVLKINGPTDEAKAIPGQPPRLGERPAGCVFEPRCALGRGRDICRSVSPLLLDEGNGDLVACHFSPRSAAAESSSLTKELTG